MPHDSVAYPPRSTISEVSDEALPPDTAWPLLTVEHHHVGRRAVLSVVGEVDVATVARLRMAIDAASATASDIWVDLTVTTFMDSSGVHALMEAHARLARANRRLALICADGPILRVLSIIGADQALDIHSSRTAAHYAT